LRVSTMCIRPTSTVKTGASNLEGMSVWQLDRTSCYVCEDTITAVCSRLDREARRESVYCCW
jgi:hypothetical protein